MKCTYGAISADCCELVKSGLEGKTTAKTCTAEDSKVAATNAKCEKKA